MFSIRFAVTAFVVGGPFVSFAPGEVACDEAQFGARIHWTGWGAASPPTLYDLNEDGVVDLIARSEFGSDTNQFLCGRGIAPERIDNLVIASGAATPVSADVNLDGRPDLVTFAADAGYVVLRNADPSFAPPLVIAPTADVSVDGFAVGDVDGDGSPDLLTLDTTHAANRLSLWRGDGTGHFTPAELIATGDQYDPAFSIVDIDQDGRLDFVALSTSHDATVIRRGLPGPSFAPAETILTNHGHAPFRIADLDADGDLDLVQSLAPDPVVLIAHNDGGALTPTGALPVTESPRLLAVADMNGDGRPDLITGEERIVIYRATEDEWFTPWGDTVSNPGTYEAELIAVDVDGDGRRDLITCNRGEATVALQHPELGFQSSITLIATTGDSPRAVELADLNQDGHLDLISIESSEPELLLRLGAGDGSFGPATAFELAGACSGIATADVNGDGWLDIATNCHQVGLLTVLLGSAEGTFTTSAELPVPVYGRSVSAGDLDGDGLVDLATSGGGDTGIPASTEVFRGAGDGTFTHWTQLLPPDGLSHMELIVDLDDDGLDDLLLNNGIESLLVFWGSEKDLTESTTMSFPLFAVRSFDTGDLDQDGMLDIVTVNSIPLNRLSTLRQTAPRTFMLDQSVMIPGGGESAAVADVNHDGALDVILKADNRTMQIHTGRGDGTFDAPRTFLGAPATAPALGDVNEEGAIDIVSAHGSGGHLAINLNRCTACPEDVNGDGAMDFDDLLLFLAAWGSDAPTFDLNHDGTVDLADLIAFLAQWGACA